MVVIVMANIERKVAINALQHTGAVQAARAARAYALLYRIFSQVFNHVTSTAPSDLRLIMTPCLPHARHVLQPEISCFDINCALGNVMLDVWVCCFVLRSHVLKRKLISCFSGPQESRSVMGDEAGLPSIRQVLARVADQILFRDEGTIKPDHMAGRGPHANGVPPGFVNADRWIGKVARQQKLGLHCSSVVSGPAGTSRAHQQNGPLGPSRTGSERFTSVDDIATFNLDGGSPEFQSFRGRSCLRFTPPRRPYLAFVRCTA